MSLKTNKQNNNNNNQKKHNNKKNPQQVETLAIFFFSEGIYTNSGRFSYTVIVSHVYVMQSWTMWEQLCLLLFRG